jgi:hypothetical protein
LRLNVNTARTVGAMYMAGCGCKPRQLLGIRKNKTNSRETDGWHRVHEFSPITTKFGNGQKSAGRTPRASAAPAAVVIRA